MRTNVQPSLPVHVRLSAFADDCGAKGLSEFCYTPVHLAFANFFLHYYFLQTVRLCSCCQTLLGSDGDAMAAVVNRCKIQNFLFSFLITKNVQKNSTDPYRCWKKFKK